MSIVLKLANVISFNQYKLFELSNFLDNKFDLEESKYLLKNYENFALENKITPQGKS